MTMELERLARNGNKMALRCLDAFNPDQERDATGRWTSGGSAKTVSEHTEAAKAHSLQSEKLHSKGKHEEASRHTAAC